MDVNSIKSSIKNLDLVEDSSSSILSANVVNIYQDQSHNLSKAIELSASKISQNNDSLSYKEIRLVSFLRKAVLYKFSGTIEEDQCMTTAINQFVNSRDEQGFILYLILDLNSSYGIENVIQDDFTEIDFNIYRNKKSFDILFIQSHTKLFQITPDLKNKIDSYLFVYLGYILKQDAKFVTRDCFKNNFKISDLIPNNYKLFSSRTISRREPCFSKKNAQLFFIDLYYNLTSIFHQKSIGFTLMCLVGQFFIQNTDKSFSDDVQDNMEYRYAASIFFFLV